ncbi:hypothetical protein EDD15DRAFT_2520246 [Pisolithus albus]|nr:hypothetical protein EDD15DRAFT_2520246 [Pisolithus albus]
MPSSKTTGVIEDTEPMKKPPASSSSRGNHQQESVVQPGLRQYLRPIVPPTEWTVFELIKTLTTTSLNPVSVVASELDQGLENPSVLWRASSEFCDKPGQPTFHSGITGIFSPWSLVTKNSTLKPEWDRDDPLSILKELASAIARRNWWKDRQDVLCLRAPRRKACGAYKTSENPEGVGLVQKHNGCGFPSNSAHPAALTVDLTHRQTRPLTPTA